MRPSPDTVSPGIDGSQGSPGFDELPCALACVDTDGRILAVNAALCELVGRRADTLTGQAFDHLLTTAGAVIYQTYLMPLMRLHGRLQEFSISVKSAAGQRLDVLLYASSRSTGAQRVHDIVMVPIHQRRRVEEELLRVKRAADESPGMIFQLLRLPDGGEHFPYVSEAIRTLYNSTPQAARASAEVVFGRVLAEDRPALLQARDEAGAQEQTWRATARVAQADGRHAWHEFTATARRLANGVTLWHGYVADVTQRRALEQALAARETARQADQAKSEFLARVSHELRTPLNAILGFTQLLQNQGADNLREDQHRRLAIMRTAGQGLLHLINEVLDITSIEMGQLSLRLAAVSLDGALDDALGVVEPLAQARQVTLARGSPCRLAVQADARRLQQVLVNLLSNAIKYNRPGGCVDVQVRVDSVDGRAHLDVTDTGPGLSAAQQEQLFQPFNRLGADAGSVEGTGLGLAVSRQLALLMNGDIGVRSAPGQGSTFCVTLPLAPAATSTARGLAVRPDARGGPGAARGTMPSAGGPPATGGRVLYVEDNPVNVLLMEAIVGLRPGVRLQVCRSCAQGLAAALSDPPTLLLLDMQLPDGDGSELLRAMRAHPSLAAVPAVAVSAAALRDDLHRARVAGFASYWTKPLMVDEVLDGLDRLLGEAPSAGA
jgi:PAS domain S-box-containing protein